MSESTSKKKATTPTSNHASLPAVAPMTQSMMQGLQEVMPRNTLLQTLASMQIPFPAPMPAITEDDAFPTDVTKVGPRDLRALQSYWAAQFARANALLGITRGEKKVQERRVDREKKKMFRTLAPERNSKTFVDSVMGQVLKSQRIGRMERRLDNLIRLEEALEPLVRDFSMYVSVIEREMMYRMSEMKNFRPGT